MRLILKWRRDQTGSQWEVCDAGVFIGLGYGKYSVSGGLGYDACKRVLYYLQIFDVGIMFNKELGVAIIYEV